MLYANHDQSPPRNVVFEIVRLWSVIEKETNATSTESAKIDVFYFFDMSHLDDIDKILVLDQYGAAMLTGR